MEFWELKKIEGFFCNEFFIEIFDNTGKSFYSFLNENNARITFNLPAGSYSTSNDITKLKTPLKYICPELPRFEKKGLFPYEFKIVLQTNPNKCSVDIKTGLIILDPIKQLEWEKPFLQFVLGHELGHVFYFTEYKCDLYSCKVMLEELGYNPSQCLYSSYICLSDNNQDRRNMTEKFLQKTKCYE